jgi:hypothetical protein
LRPIVHEKPKQPLSAFFRFSDAVRATVREEHNLSFEDLAKVLGHMWKELPESEKEPYKEMERRDKEKYQAAMIEFETRYPELKSKKTLRAENKGRR